jgi:glycogen operon protein
MGAHWDGEGLNIAVPSTHAQQVELCLFEACDDGSGTHRTIHRETHRAALPGRSQDVWHGYLRARPGQSLGRPGQLYGLRVHGPWQPEDGHRFNPRKVLLDPWGREIAGRFEWRPEHFDHDREYPHLPDPHDNGATALKSCVVDGHFDWGDDRPPRVPPADTVLLELHVRSWTRLHPGVPEALRGTYAGLEH